MIWATPLLKQWASPNGTNSSLRADVWYETSPCGLRPVVAVAYQSAGAGPIAVPVLNIEHKCLSQLAHIGSASGLRSLFARSEEYRGKDGGKQRNYGYYHKQFAECKSFTSFCSIHALLPKGNKLNNLREYIAFGCLCQ